MNRHPILKRIRNISISVFVLLMVFVGAGLGYSWFNSQNPSVASVSKPASTLPSGTIKHTKLAENSPSNASVQTITSPVAPGNNASVTVKSNPGSTCSISVEYNKIPSKDTGLVDRTSDDFGMITWAWTVEANVPEGVWPVTVTCFYNKKSAVVETKLVVSKTATE